MKAKNVNIILTVVILGGIATAIYLVTKNKNKPEDKKEPKKNEDNKKVSSILFVGDSNTFANFSYADQLKKLYPNLKIKKIAMNGANSDWARTQLERELQNNKYDIISILIGSNDIYGGKSIASTKGNLDAMYNLAHNKGSKVLAITPPSKDFYLERTNAKQNMLSDLINWMKSNKNIDDFINFKAMTPSITFFSSGDEYLHPQAQAHKLLAGRVQQDLQIA